MKTKVYSKFNYLGMKFQVFWFGMKRNKMSCRADVFFPLWESLVALPLLLQDRPSQVKIFPASDVVHSAGLWFQPSMALTEFFGSVNPQPCTETFPVAPENFKCPVLVLPNSTASVSADLGWLSMILDIWGVLSLWLLYVLKYSVCI